MQADETGMIGNKWWEGLFAGTSRTRDLALVGSESDHFERCPFCWRVFDTRDLEQVLAHYDHQVESDARPEAGLSSTDDQPKRSAAIVPFKWFREAYRARSAGRRGAHCKITISLRQHGER
jgi:hypothetical protein